MAEHDTAETLAQRKSLFGAAIDALQKGDANRAHTLLLEVLAIAPDDLLVLMTLSSACRIKKDVPGELQAINAALALDPYYLPGLLARGYWCEAHGTRASAATALRNALRVAPPESQWPDFLRSQLLRARDYVQRYSADYDKYLQQKLNDLQAALPSTLQSRWQEARSLLAGRSQPYTSQSNQLHVPRLPAVTFFEREYFPWADALESHTTVIRSELENVIATHPAGFAPYIAYKPGDPVNQWQELNHSLRWSSYQLWRSGQPITENLERCPKTAQALSAFAMADISGLCPNVMFSALAPHTQIPPHHGETNARIVVHLPLIIPAGCRYRVGFDECDWQVGKILAFDDTLEHAARNDSDQLRVILIFDVWNPLLTVPERKLVGAMAEAARIFGV